MAPDIKNINSEKGHNTGLETTSVSWLKDRAESCDIFDAMIRDEKARTGSGETLIAPDYLGKALWITFLAVVISGIGLLAGYSPSITGAFSSVVNIQTGSGLGWLLRGVHKYGTDLLVILAVLRLIRIAYRRAYKFGGELGWICALAATLFAMISGLSGYLLLWNQRVFTSGSLTNNELLNYEQIFPLGGLGLKGWFANWIAGGDGMNQTMLASVFAIHIGLSAIVILFVVFWRNTKRDQVPIHKNFSMKIPINIIWYIIGGLMLLALIAAPPLGVLSYGILAPHPILADWYFLGLYELAGMFPSGVFIFMVFVGLGLAILLPWIDRSARPGPRLSVTALITAVLLTWLLFTLRSLGLNISDLFTLTMTFVLWVVLLAVGFIRENRLKNRVTVDRDREVTGR
ncbi:MAG: cytochrome b N-terminal domain-containing protein [bacterium]|nr:cytochrome b N-terminal domain-containing protein [bacterium]